MLHYVLFSHKNGKKLFSICFFCLITGLLLSAISASAAEQAVDQTGKNIISKLTVQTDDKNLVLRLQGATEPTYTIYELFKPSRIVVDVANAEISDPDRLTLPEDLHINLTTKSIKDMTPNLTRFEFTLPHSYPFTTSQQHNDIVITLENFRESRQTETEEKQPVTAATADKTLAENPPATETAPLVAVQEKKKSNQTQSIENQLPEVNPLQIKSNEPSSQATAMQDAFNFSGYNKNRITVDFYKIDLHNVFRLLKEVSGVNIVVDDSVSGSLTLAVDDVPWDFVLDIILNLKDLQKEEQFNTIVIHPKSKVFNWPKRAEDNLSFEADEGMAAQESLIIQQQKKIPQAVVDAKKLIAKARKAEKHGDAEKAVLLYEQAFEKWPDNSWLANKIAALYLVRLRKNAKASYFADKALIIDGTNSNAALNAAIAHANMQENTLAQQYFDQSISNGKPTSEALLSYATFSEQLDHYDAAIKLLVRHDEIYGQTLNSMVARARILDKYGKHETATKVYQAILLAGFRVPPDLRKFINSRIKLNQSM